MKKILIAATSSNTGKTTISMGIMKALKERNLRVQPFKVGPDYIDTSYHSFITKSKSRNLDEFMLSEDIIKNLFAKNSKEKDISIIEGVMGLYDGYGDDINYCTSSKMSKILKAPVILVIDGKGLSTSAAAMVLGYKNLDKEVDIKGVIINNLSSENHYTMIKSAIEKYTDVEVLGYLPKNIDFTLESRHLGLVPSGELDNLEMKFKDLANIVEEHINIDRIIELSESDQIDYIEEYRPDYSGLTLAVAYDKAFNFYYWDSIDLFEEMNIEVKYFSPLEDSKVPDCDFVYIGGGFPELFAKELGNNLSMKADFKRLYNQGVPIYAECGGLMYLGEKVKDLNGREFEMLGLLEGVSIMTKGLKRFGYSKGTAMDDNILAKRGQFVFGHEFHHSDFFTKEQCAFEMTKIKNKKVFKRWKGGITKNNILGTYLHTHFNGNVKLAINLCEIAKSNKEKRN
ncbi:MAG: cobyrinate a,c-diamide synthase [Peptostreptococcaceae bacterium]|jgi:cobyrinic acid a,c-diamide synthase|nr:cobyrinate a,c-diamide synthase [Peptostreptococcaceae bacterium]